MFIRSKSNNETNKEKEARILALADTSKNYGICPPPMDPQVALNELARYFLGDNWYFYNITSTSAEQINTEIVLKIEMRYKGAKKK